MEMNNTPSGERLHIGFFGRRNAGKSSLVNAITNQELSVVSDVQGTTTDPVKKAMELLPIGPVMLIDTPGFDDEGQLGDLRVQKTKQILNRTDVAVLVVDAVEGLKSSDQELMGLFSEKEIPFVLVWNKTELGGQEAGTIQKLENNQADDNAYEMKQPEETKESYQIWVSAKQKEGIHQLKELIGKVGASQETTKKLVSDLLHPSDFVVLVVPIDSAAPKGRIILPQQQVIRDVLDIGATAIVVREHELAETLEKLGTEPSMVITDSQVFARVNEVVPENIRLTSFSILMARYKGFLDVAVQGVKAIDSLKDGDKILISEGCTHHRQCDDIGTVKLPRWLKEYTKKEIVFDTSSGGGFSDNLSEYALVIHCGGCMLNERELRYRMKCALDAKVPFTNYGIAIAYMKGILKRCESWDRR